MISRKFACFLLPAVLTVMTIACATTKPQTQGKNDLIIRGQQENPNVLKKNQFLSITHAVNAPNYLVASNWSKVRIFSDFLDVCNAHKEFSNEQKYELLSFIFDQLPLNGTDGVIREVYIGQYFLNGDPLVIRIGIFTPENEAALVNEKVIVLMSNLVEMKDGTINKKMGGFINLDINPSVICGLQKGLLTNGQKTETKEVQNNVNIESLPSIQQVMIAQSYLADENIENDIIVNQLMPKIFNDNQEQPAIIIIAMLQQYYYLLSIEDISNAESLWTKIKEYSLSVPGDMKPDTLEALNGESLYLMKRLIANR